MLSLLFQTLLLTQTATGPAHSSEKPGMAVLDLALKGGVDKNVGDMLNELVLARLNESGRFGTVLGGSDIKVAPHADYPIERRLAVTIQEKPALPIDHPLITASAKDEFFLPPIVAHQSHGRAQNMPSP